MFAFAKPIFEANPKLATAKQVKQTIKQSNNLNNQTISTIQKSNNQTISTIKQSNNLNNLNNPTIQQSQQSKNPLFMLDILITNATIYNGKNELPTISNVGIKNGKIECITNDLSHIETKETIDATGLFLSPGFIDPHASTGFGYFFPRAADHKLYQGITTEIFGNCGTSPAPIGKHLVPTMQQLSNEIGFSFSWRSTTEYFEAIQDKLQFNIATLVGHSTLRGGVLEDWNKVSDTELEQMKTDLAQAMDEGALGMSTGLIYAPGCFAELNELIALTKVVKSKGGVYASHIRNERDKIEEAVEEALTIGRAAEIDVLVSHLKAAEQRNWGKIPKILETIEDYNAQNEHRAVVDVYPYTAVSTKLRAFIPKYILKDGIAAVANKVQQPSVIADIAAHIRQQGFDLSQMLIISNDFPDFFGKNVAEIAALIGKTTAETIAHLLAKSTEMWIVYHCIHPNDMDAAILWQEAMICTDSWSYLRLMRPKRLGIRTLALMVRSPNFWSDTLFYKKLYRGKKLFIKSQISQQGFLN